MRAFVVMIAGALLLLGLMAGAALASGPSQTQLERAGWDCFDVGPEPHCVSPSAGFFDRVLAGDASIPVLVFGADGSFKGTELLLRADLYAGQPCPQDQVLDLQELSGIPYFACHHYAQ